MQAGDDGVVDFEQKLQPVTLVGPLLLRHLSASKIERVLHTNRYLKANLAQQLGVFLGKGPFLATCHIQTAQHPVVRDERYAADRSQTSVQAKLHRFRWELREIGTRTQQCCS